MEKPIGYEEKRPGGRPRPRMKKYMVYINDIFYWETMAVSPEKAANNTRWKIYEESAGWWEVPPIEAFDCIEV
jgi:hypothetical protein